MLNTQQKSTNARDTLFLLVALLAFAAALAARPAAGQAAPSPLAFEPASYDFGLQGVDWGSQQANLQLRNNSSEPVATEYVELGGPGSEAFWTGYSDCSWRLMQPDETCSVQVYFSPRDVAEYTAELRVYAESSVFSADLRGEGGRAILAPQLSPVDFGASAVGSPGVTREIKVSNVGNLPGGVFIAVISGGAVGSFQVLDESCTGFELAPAATCSVQVRFKPLGEGIKKATLSLFGDAGGGMQVSLAGVGTAPPPEGASQAQAAAPSSSVTSIVNTNTTTTNNNRVVRRGAQAQKRKPKRGRGFRQHRRGGLKLAQRIATAPRRG